MIIEIGIVQKILVFENNIRIGYGLMITWSNRVEPPILFSNDGIELEKGWYYLKPTDETYLITYNGVIQ